MLFHLLIVHRLPISASIMTSLKAVFPNHSFGRSSQFLSSNAAVGLGIQNWNLSLQQDRDILTTQSVNRNFWCEIWGFHGEESSDRGLLGCDAV